MDGRAAVVGVVVAGWAATAGAAELWVDTTLAADCADYDVAARACGGGDQAAFATLAAADAAAGPGDVVTVRAGEFTEPFVVTASGSEGSPVVFRARAGETVRFTAIDSAGGAINVTGRSWVEIEGFVVEFVGSWVRVEDSRHVVLRGNTFHHAAIEGTRGSVKLLRSDDCTLENNALIDANDNLTIVDSRRNRVIGNGIFRGRHSLISVRCSEANVFRGNVLVNPDQKAAEVFDCEGASSDDPVRFEATPRNLWEGNLFGGTAPSDASHDFNAMQLAGQDGIVRRNAYQANLGGGVHLQVYPEEALANHGNRVYHNTFYDNRCFALASSTAAGGAYHDNVVTANLLYANADCAGGGEQMAPGDPVASVFVDNALATRDPGFLDPAMQDLRLAPDSPVVDTGPWLTRTVGAGAGTELAVADARFFWDGAGVPGEPGDLVQLAGDTATARVLAVDLAAGLLTLDAPLTWSDGQGLALAYAGAAPDPGAFEVGLAAPGDTDGEDTTGGGSDDTGADDPAAPTTSGESGAPTPAGSDATGDASTGGQDGGGEAGGCACRGDAGRGAPWLLALLAVRRRRVNAAPSHDRAAPLRRPLNNMNRQLHKLRL
jgi:hypothetical protein